VAKVKATYDRLIADGLPVATALADAVNLRILRHATRRANETQEIQTPPQVGPHHVERLCPTCSGGAGKTVIHVPKALAVVPDTLFQASRLASDRDHDSGSPPG
jgi:hypothetical protein